MSEVNYLKLMAEVEERYRRYLKTTFYLKDPLLRKAFQDSLDSNHLTKGPYIEATPSFKQGDVSRKTFEKLLSFRSDDGFLSALKDKRFLYLHQEKAIQKAFSQSRNIVVTTGTASGKTESFLYPILLYLYEKVKKEGLNPGINALILYPLNALVNDQRERLGEISKELYDKNSEFNFTFGQYTGETPKDKNDHSRQASERIKNRLYGELVLREEIRENPPNILLTNYSMLEYLLIRPDDNPLFSKRNAKSWKFLVIDEVHQYKGTNGCEMAMLIRKLKQKILENGYENNFTCIATSATIANTNEDKKNVATFAENLFGENFSKEDIILGEVNPISTSNKIEIDSSDYQVIKKSFEENSKNKLLEIGKKYNLNIDENLEIAEIAGAILKDDYRSSKIRKIITKQPKEILKIANEFFSDARANKRIETLFVLINILIKSTISGASLLSARYHFFIRSLEGAYITYYPRKSLFLERKSIKKKGSIFEVTICKECGQHYIIGNIENKRLETPIRDPGHKEFNLSFFLPIENKIKKSTPENSGKIFKLCTKCSTVEMGNHMDGEMSCGHANTIFIEEQEKTKGKDDQLSKCGHCGYTSTSSVREIIHGADGSNAVIATTMHQVLPEDRRKILAFTDGRQDAAFFAWYLEKSYEDILTRNYILKIINKIKGYSDEGVSLREIAKELFTVFREENILPPEAGTIEVQQRVWHNLYREFLTGNSRISIENVGLLQWCIKWPANFKIPSVFFSSPWSLNKEEAQNLIFVMLNFMRFQGGVELKSPDNISLDWKELNIFEKQTKLKIGSPNNLTRTISWDGKSNNRALFLRKILKEKGLEKEKAITKTEDALRLLWESLRATEDELFISANDGYRLNPDWWRAFPVSTDCDIFQCKTCSHIQYFSINNVCTRYRCNGRVYKIKANKLESNHYHVLYNEELPKKLRAEEHTAQINKDKANKFQKAFKNGDINFLSSSTTFELGVDLGDLDIIFLRNIPPENFNYTQRVGRSGRRSGSPGFAINFCRRSPHDLYHFADPVNRILQKNINVPVISLKNEKIINRHIFAIILSYFFKSYGERFNSVESLFVDLRKPSALSDLIIFLEKEKNVLSKTLKHIVPPEMIEQIGLHNNDWIKKMTDAESPFARAEAEISNDFKNIIKIKKTFIKKEDFASAGWATKREKTIANENVLSFLSRKAIIPKYGFPVDIVELDARNTQQYSGANNVLLQRDLVLAISEFAPTSKVIANKKEWTSYGIKIVTGKDWEKWNYCLDHEIFIKNSDLEAGGEKICCRKLKSGKFIIPRFGFVTDFKKPKDPIKKPSRAFTSRPYFAGLVKSQNNEIDYGMIKVTNVAPGQIITLCHGHKGKGFYICNACGAGFNKTEEEHKTPYGIKCNGRLESLTIGHEFVTDVLQIYFTNPPSLDILGFAYSLAYAIIAGAGETIGVPSSDLNATIAYKNRETTPTIILYDNVPGGANLVAQLEKKEILFTCLESALKRVGGECGCGEMDSCYGCLKNYRNQFIHHKLQRGPVMNYLKSILIEKNRK